MVFSLTLGCVVWFKTVTTTPSKVILASTGQALPGLPGSGSGRMSDWREVPSSGEAPFEFTSGEKQRHKVGFCCAQCNSSNTSFYLDISQASFSADTAAFQLFSGLLSGKSRSLLSHGSYLF